MTTPKCNKVERSLDLICGKISSGSSIFIDFEKLKLFIENLFKKIKFNGILYTGQNLYFQLAMKTG